MDMRKLSVISYVDRHRVTTSCTRPLLTPRSLRRFRSSDLPIVDELKNPTKALHFETIPAMPSCSTKTLMLQSILWSQQNLRGTLSKPLIILEPSSVFV